METNMFSRLVIDLEEKELDLFVVAALMHNHADSP